MQITIAITMPYHKYREWRIEENKNADGSVQKSIDGRKEIERKQQAFHFQFENADDTKQIKDDTKQKCGMKTYGICGSPGSQFCKSGIGILQKGEVIP
ncbi:hypothetical protein T4D_6817 [Trichinella pseudospiralis]|uniref:Uncharacterized protein n=1 Tax=Trichinella pseudospiralis TaxID=6337 RepID=A0A0V1FFH7_TRIPS|nr:hypothetical protein T4D_6817 [Trichinella pseudospiralis]